MYDPGIHHRRSIRLKDFDYSSRGLYFVTVCVHEREQILSAIRDAESHNSPLGNIVRETWNAIPERFPTVQPDAFVVMPNHIHGVLAFVGTGLPVQGKFLPTAGAPPTLGQVMRAFKSISAIAVNKTLGRTGVPVWQRNYYEHVIRNSRELEVIQNYVGQNPARWEFDPENPNAKRPDQNKPWEET